MRYQLRYVRLNRSFLDRSGKNTAMGAREGMRGSPLAYAGGLWASDLVEISADARCLDGQGRWIVVLPYAGEPRFLRFARWNPNPPQDAIGAFRGPAPTDWVSSCSADDYVAAVERVRRAIASGEVYQVNVCRLLTAALPAMDQADVAGLAALLAQGNPAPHAAMVRVPQEGLAIASASPELFLRREGDVLTTGPIKGTAATADGLLDKDRAENVMIVDLMRNDLSRVCQPGTVTVPRLLETQTHPGLVHLVSTVSGHRESACGWPEILQATFPPGSVTGAPKIAAIDLIASVEPAPRDVYCGALGWVDADRGTASLAVAIRTFWQRDRALVFGTGAGITWSSNGQDEWHETELKARRLLATAAGFHGPPS